MLLLLAGAVDLGRIFYTYVGMENAAREGAAFAIFNAPASPGDPPDLGGITAAARGEMGGDASLAVAANCPGSDCTATEDLEGNTITVRVSLTFTFIMPLIPAMDLSASSSAVVISAGVAP